jgi:hypothetical protein
MRRFQPEPPFRFFCSIFFRLAADLFPKYCYLSPIAAARITGTIFSVCTAVISRYTDPRFRLGIYSILDPMKWYQADL